MRIKIIKSKNTIIYYIIRDYTKNGKRSTAIVERLDNKNKISELAETKNISIKLWLKNYLENINKNIV